MDNTKVSIRQATKEYPKYVVLVHKLKFDQIRQETYWVLKEFREYHTRSNAETFATRFL